MKFTNLIRKITFTVALTVVPFIASAQRPNDDEILLVVDKNEIRVDSLSNSHGSIFKYSGEQDDCHYYLYTSQKYIKLKFGEMKDGVSQNIFIDPSNAIHPLFFDSNKDKLSPETNTHNKQKYFSRTIIEYEDRTIGLAEDQQKGTFYFVKAGEKEPIMRLSVCLASSHQGATGAIVFADENVTTKIEANGSVVISISDKSAIDTLDVRIPANTVLKEVKFGEKAHKSFVKTEVFASDFEAENVKQLCLTHNQIDRLVDGQLLTLTFVAFDEDGVLSNEFVMTYKFQYTGQNPKSALLWWHYLIASIAIVIIITTIGVIFWLKRKKSVAKKKRDDQDDDTLYNETVELEERECTEISISQISKELEAEREARRLVEESFKQKCDLLEEAMGQLGQYRVDLEAVENKLAHTTQELANTQRLLNEATEMIENCERDFNEKIEIKEKEHESIVNNILDGHALEKDRLCAEHKVEIECMHDKHTEMMAEKDREYDRLRQKYESATTLWKSDRGQILSFFQSQFEFIDKYLANILTKADTSAPIYEILEQLRDTAYGYDKFREYIINTLQAEDRSVAELISDVREFVVTNMQTEMSWINNAARLYAYASTEALKSVFGHYEDAAKDTKILFGQIEILVAMWGITGIYIPTLLKTKYNDEEHNYCISNLVLPSIYPSYSDHLHDMMIYDFLQVGYVVNGQKIKAVVAY